MTTPTEPRTYYTTARVRVPDLRHGDIVAGSSAWHTTIVNMHQPMQSHWYHVMGVFANDVDIEAECWWTDVTDSLLGIVNALPGPGLLVCFADDINSSHDDMCYLWVRFTTYDLVEIQVAS
jgi:hypothetical protein